MTKQEYITFQELRNRIKKGVKLELLDSDGDNLKFSITDDDNEEPSIIFVIKDDDREMVNHPKHYNHTSVECIDIISKLPLSLGSAIKYLWRFGYKEDNRKDIRKCLFYINILIQEYNDDPETTEVLRLDFMENPHPKIDEACDQLIYGKEIKALYFYRNVDDLEEIIYSINSKDR